MVNRQADNRRMALEFIKRYHAFIDSPFVIPETRYYLIDCINFCIKILNDPPEERVSWPAFYDYNLQFQTIEGGSTFGENIDSMELWRRKRRRRRDEILKMTIDKVNPMWLKELSAKDKKIIQDYRKLLLEFPNDTSKPEPEIPDIFLDPYQKKQRKETDTDDESA